MNAWNEAKVEELTFGETEHGLTGIYRDGGYIGDGELSGHLTWRKSEEAPSNPSQNS